MGFFTNSSPFDADVEKATNEKNTAEEWGQIMDICDKVGTSSQNAKDCLRSVTKRLNAQDPHIVMQAITLLDACASNCGKSFHLEVASRDFEGELRKLINRSQTKVAERLKNLLKKWAEGDFKTDPQLNLIPSLYNKLRSEGIEFPTETPRKVPPVNKDPNVVSSSQEEEDIAKAIELSLKENKQHHHAAHRSPPSRRSTSLYPSVSTAMSTASSSEGRKVRALYDFEAAEDNELTFLAGEIIHILDDTDPNWWKGSNHRGEGLFPSNFVTADLSVEPEQFTKLDHGGKKSVQFAEEVEVKQVKREPEMIEVEIDEGKMDRLLHLLHEADPECEATDTQEMIDLEEQVTAMGPLIDAALEKVDRRHAQLTQLSSDLVDALNLYHTLMREPPPQAQSGYTLPKMGPPQHVYPFPNQGPPHQSMMYNGMPQQPSFNTAGIPQQGPYPPGLPVSDYMGPPANMATVSLPPRFHVQPGHPLPGHPQQAPGHPQPQHGHPQGPPVHAQLPQGHSSQQPQGHSQPSHHPQPPQGLPPTQGHHQPPQVHPQAHHQVHPSQPDQTIVYNQQPQGFPNQGPPLGAFPGPAIGGINQQQPYAPANGQRMM